jgi:hypothetical protein
VIISVPDSYLKIVTSALFLTPLATIQLRMQIKQLLKWLRADRGQPAKKQLVSQQPIPDVTSEDVDRIIRRDFSAFSFAEVKAILNEYGVEKFHVGVNRVRVATLKLANGDVERLRIHMQSAKNDYRDVLAAAEFPGYMKAGLRIRKLPAKERTRIIDGDWRQYDEWLRKPE